MLIIFNVIEGKTSIYCHSNYCPVFGAGYDFSIISESNINKFSYSNIGYSYDHPYYNYCTNEATYFLASSEYFLTADI